MASSSSSSSSGWNHDVFLSFRGPDTRNTFTGHLYHALKAKGINTFIDNELERGQHISDSLVKVIEGSRISIVIFSTDYAGSSSCLEELVKILECRKLKGQLVLPVFYNVNPSDVEKQSGTYADSLAKLEAQLEVNSKQMEEWKSALSQTSTLSGWPLDNGNEAEFIQKIVERVSRELNHVSLHVADHPVGLESHIQEMANLLSIETKEAQFVGIRGLGGVGKTTIAKAVFNENAKHFEGSCFLKNVKDTPNEEGLVKLQKTLLEDILGPGGFTFKISDAGIQVIQQRLCDKRVLIVIDDVDKRDQLKTLAGSLSWFGPRSRIIVTSRDEHVLKAHGVKRIHHVKELYHEYALELFSWNAFTKPEPDEDYLELSRSVIKYAQGLPLALVILGSLLNGKSKPYWECELQNLKNSPNKEISDILKISYDKLYPEQKKIFLDIACFFKGEDKDDVMKILVACYLNPTNCVEDLEKKSLLRIEDNKIQMHDLVEAMGRQVVNDESPNINERSRLWNQGDVLRLLTEDMIEDMEPFKTEAIVSLVIGLYGITEGSVADFTKMKKLKILIINGAKMGWSLESLSSDLRWLEWDNCLLESLPSKFRAKNLVTLKMPYSYFRELGACFESFVNLKELDLSCCWFLTKTPDFSRIRNLESLCLWNCTNLVEVHESIASLNELKILTLASCFRLEILPSRFKLGSLSLLELGCCRKLKMFPEIVEEMPCLERLDLSCTAIELLPSSLCNISGLKYLVLTRCEQLKEIRELPLNIRKVRAECCYSLERLPRIFAFNWKEKPIFDFTNCHKLGDWLENRHDVFLSFRRSDPSNNITEHLYHALKAKGINTFADDEGKGINTFVDDEELRGQYISDSRVRSIEGSRISIVILSPYYAGSSSCLAQLVKILECRELRGQLVLPLFCHVHPSDVENQSGKYADSLANLETQSDVTLEKMEEWRLALFQMSTLSDRHLNIKRNEAKFIQTIVEEVSTELNRVSLHIADPLVGLKSHIQDMADLLSFETKEAQFVGIHGLGGVGKTTIAKAVFNKYANQFEGSCFLANVKETPNEKGFLELQESLLMKILGPEGISFESIDEGIKVIQRQLRDKRVLIVIDDVDKMDQLKNLVGALSWFGPGSRIIITTRDEQLLKAYGVKRIHHVKELCHEDALELFSWYALKKPQPDEDYLELSRSIIKHAQGLPLALVVLGAFLYGRSKPEWESELLNLNRNPNKEINDILERYHD